MAALQEYKCPCCGGAIAFDSALQKMKCPFCDTEFEMEALKSYDEQLNSEKEDDFAWDTNAGTSWLAGETDGMRVYACNSCGGEIVGDENMAATSCPYCNNPVVVMGNFKGSLKPDIVIPFKLDKEAAKKALSEHVHGKKLVPKVFKDKKHIDEIKGIYVPFWLFDAEADADISFRGTKVRSWSDSSHRYTETSHYLIKRSGSLAFRAVPVDGSTKMPDDLMESIEPYDLSEAVDFQTAYLAGYLADKYDVDAKRSVERANARVKTSTEQVIASSVKGYASVTTESSSVRLYNGKAKYALYPVWLLNTKWENQTYTFAMNGQTGKFVGDLPMDKKAKFKWFLISAAIIAAAVFGVQMLINLLV